MPKTKQEKALRAKTPESVRPSNAPRQMERHTFTPGPWYQNGYAIRSLFGREDRWQVATVRFGDTDYDLEALANARLIAAAPELLKALKYANRFLQPKDTDKAFVESAIAKAEGRE